MYQPVQLSTTGTAAGAFSRSAANVGLAIVIATNAAATTGLFVITVPPVIEL
jgi:hypothetical protein